MSGFKGGEMGLTTAFMGVHCTSVPSNTLRMSAPSAWLISPKLYTSGASNRENLRPMRSRYADMSSMLSFQNSPTKNQSRLNSSSICLTNLCRKSTLKCRTASNRIPLSGIVLAIHLPHASTSASTSGCE